MASYVESLGREAHEWLLALYVDDGMHLLGVITIARGDINSCPIPARQIMLHGIHLRAAAYILVHNHPSGDPTPSRADMQATVSLARLSADLELRLLDHLIIAGDKMTSCGYF